MHTLLKTFLVVMTIVCVVRCVWILVQASRIATCVQGSAPCKACWDTHPDDTEAAITQCRTACVACESQLAPLYTSL